MLTTVILMVLISFYLYPQEKEITLVIQQPESARLTDEEYKKIKNDLFQIIEKENPRSALNSLKLLSQKNAKVLGSCHEFLHEIGFESYKKYKDFAKALTFKDEICVAGYTHGVIEGYFSEVTDVSGAIHTICKSYPDGSYIAWECYHGVGHGLMYFNQNDVLLSLNGCKMYDNHFASSACSNGVFMENFNADSIVHPSKYLNPKMPYYPCNEIEQDKADCYMNAPIYFLSLNNYDFLSATSLCNKVESKYRYNCHYGLASQMTRRNMNSPKQIEEYCVKKSGDSQACINGMVGWFVSYYASLKEATALCDILEKKNKSQCIIAVESFRGQFE